MPDLDDLLRLLVAAAFVAAALAKSLLPARPLARIGMTVVAGLAPGVRMGIALLELAGAIGLVAPAAFGAPDWIARLAAAGLTVLMAGASWLQLRRRRSLGAAITLVLLAATLSLAVTPSAPVGLP